MNWLRALARFFEKKIGLHRLGVVLSVVIIAVAAVVLYRKLHNIHLAKVLNAMATVEYRDVAIAALFVAAGYFTLTFYDLFALRTIGRRDVPYRIAALAGFHMAARAGMGSRNFIRRFKSATGRLPGAYVQTLRIAAARDLLEQGEPSIQRVCGRIGYEDVAYFRGLFKRHTGMTPAEYRERFAKMGYERGELQGGDKATAV